MNEQEVICQSSKRIVLRELTGLQQTNADRAAKDPLAILSYRTAMAIASIDDQTLEPAKSDLDLDERLQRLSGRDLNELSEAYAKNFALTDLDLGNAFRRGA